MLFAFVPTTVQFFQTLALKATPRSVGLETYVEVYCEARAGAGERRIRLNVSVRVNVPAVGRQTGGCKGAGD